MTNLNNNSLLTEETLGIKALRLLAVIVVLLAVFYLATLPENYLVRGFFTAIAVILFYYLPRIFYTRYKRVILNEEVKHNFYPHGIFERLVYSTKKQLSASFMFLLTGLMLYYLVVTKNDNGIQIALISLVVTFAVSAILTVPLMQKFFHEDETETIFPFYRRSIAAIIAGLVCFTIAFIYFGPRLTAEEAFKHITSAVTTDVNDIDGYLTITGQVLDIVASLKDYALSKTFDTTWYLPLKALLIALPYGLLGAHIAIIIGVLSLPLATAKEILNRQQWIKTDRGIVKRYWKTIALPFFLFAFFGAAFYYGYPYYLKYKPKLVLTEIHSKKSSVYDLIDGQYYEPGTVKKIDTEKLHAINRMKDLLNNAINEVNNVFAEEEDRLQNFVKWYKEARTSKVFSVGNGTLIENYKSIMNLYNLNIQLQNIRKELAQENSKIYAELGIYIDTVSSENEKKFANDEEKAATGRKHSSKEINTIRLANGTIVPIRENFRMMTQLPDVSLDLLDDFNNPKSPWFFYTPSKEEQQLEDNIFDAIDKQKPDEGKTDKKADEKDSNETEAPEEIESEEDSNISEDKLMLYALNILNSERSNIIKSLSKGIGIPYTDEESDNTISNEDNKSMEDPVDNTEDNADEDALLDELEPQKD